MVEAITLIILLCNLTIRLIGHSAGRQPYFQASSLLTEDEPSEMCSLSSLFSFPDRALSIRILHEIGVDQFWPTDWYYVASQLTRGQQYTISGKLKLYLLHAGHSIVLQKPG